MSETHEPFDELSHLVSEMLQEIRGLRAEMAQMRERITQKAQAQARGTRPQDTALPLPWWDDQPHGDTREPDEREP